MKTRLRKGKPYLCESWVEARWGVWYSERFGKEWDLRWTLVLWMGLLAVSSAHATRCVNLVLYQTLIGKLESADALSESAGALEALDRRVRSVQAALTRGKIAASDLGKRVGFFTWLFQGTWGDREAFQKLGEQNRRNRLRGLVLAQRLHPREAEARARFREAFLIPASFWLSRHQERLEDPQWATLKRALEELQKLVKEVQGHYRRAEALREDRYAIGFYAVEAQLQEALNHAEAALKTYRYAARFLRGELERILEEVTHTEDPDPELAPLSDILTVMLDVLLTEAPARAGSLSTTDWEVQAQQLFELKLLFTPFVPGVLVED